jgi:hypothetical protein
MTYSPSAHARGSISNSPEQLKLSFAHVATPPLKQHFIYSNVPQIRNGNKALAAFKKSVRTKEANRFGKIFSDMVDQWLHNPSGIPSLGGQRDPTINAMPHTQANTST